jgi:hypothetical protein
MAAAPVIRESKERVGIGWPSALQMKANRTTPSRHCASGVEVVAESQVLFSVGSVLG